jgi:hypothetical protein
LLLVSIADRLKDQDATAQRLLQNPIDLGNIFAKYFGSSAGKTVHDLFSEHLIIGGDLITALRDKRTSDVDRLRRQWYQNADNIATALSHISPNYNNQQLRRMMFRHLDLTTQEINQRLLGNYSGDITAFGKVEHEALEMADYLANGLTR